MDQCLRQEIDEHDIQLEYGICWAVLNMTGWWFGTFFIFHDKKGIILPLWLMFYIGFSYEFTNWLVVSNIFIFHHKKGIIHQPLTFIFFKMVIAPPTRYVGRWCIYIYAKPAPLFLPKGHYWSSLPSWTYWCVLRRVAGWVAGGCWDDYYDGMDHSRKYPAFSTSKWMTVGYTTACCFPASNKAPFWEHPNHQAD